MNLSWRDRLAAEPHWQLMSSWPLVSTHAFTRQKKAAFQRNIEMVAAALTGEPLGEIAQRYGLSPAILTRLMNRCLGGPADGEPALSRGLVPYQQLDKSLRRSPLATHTKKCGARCSFECLLDTLPDLKVYLVKLIRASVNQTRRGQNLAAKPLHALFLAYLETHNWPRDAYPYTSKSRGYESVRRFLNTTAAELTMPTAPSREIRTRQLASRAFAEIQIDEHTLDCNGAAAVVLQGQMKPLRLARICVLVARDVATGCYLAHTIALTQHPSADDVLALFEAMNQPWEPLELTTPGLSYGAAAPYPAALGETFLRPAYGIIRLDNALAHLSRTVRHMVAETLLATVNFGLPRVPKGRNVIEQAFARLNIDIHRFPSTTGSHTQDPIREPRKNLKSAPCVSLKVLEEALSVLLAEFNIRPLANQGGVSPIEQIEYQMQHHLVPLRAPRLGPVSAPFESVREVTVRRPDTAGGQRINFEKVSYVGPALSASVLTGQKVMIRFDRRDLRTLHVQTLEGRPLGVVHAPRTWQRFPHSLATRKKINRLIREGQLSRRDPLGGYFAYTSAHHTLPSQALTLVQLSREFGGTYELANPEDSSTELLDEPGSNADLAGALTKLPDWDASMVRRRR